MTGASTRLKVQHLHGPDEIPYRKDELVVVCLVRNGRPYVNAFVEHYFSLGVKHIVFLDNGSSDGTVESLKGYDKITVQSTQLPFKGNHVQMRQYLIARFGKDRWSLCVDIDELFDYPYSDVIDLSSFLGYLNSKSYTAVTAQMLDMFPEKPVLERADERDEPLKEVHRFYDISNINRRSRRRIEEQTGRKNTVESDEIEYFMGGIRNSTFDLWPHLTKYPLVFSNGKVKPMDGSPHEVSNARIADITCVLFHYKFLSDIRERVERAVQEQSYWSNSQNYRRMLGALNRHPNLELKLETSREITTTNELLENQFLRISKDYVRWVNAAEKRSLEHLTTVSDELAEALLESRRRERTKTLEIQSLKQQLSDGETARRKLKRRVRKLRQHLDATESSQTSSGISLRAQAAPERVVQWYKAVTRHLTQRFKT